MQGVVKLCTGGMRCVVCGRGLALSVALVCLSPLVSWMHIYTMPHPRAYLDGIRLVARPLYSRSIMISIRLVAFYLVQYLYTPDEDFVSLRKRQLVRYMGATEHTRGTAATAGVVNDFVSQRFNVVSQRFAFHTTPIPFLTSSWEQPWPTTDRAKMRSPPTAARLPANPGTLGRG